MASVLSICNAALGRLGDDATVSSIDPPEGSQQAEHCAMFYPIARDIALSMHEWNFATASVVPAVVSGAALRSWTYAYAVPSQNIKIVQVLDPSGSIEADYILEAMGDDTQIVLTNQEDAVLRYIKRVTDTTRYTALFVDALGWLLASYLAGPLIKGETGVQMAQASYQAYLGALQRAIGFDVQQHQPPTPPVPTPWILDR